MAVHPGSEITLSTSVEYTPTFIEVPSSDITLSTDVVTVPPDATGGQPDVHIVVATSVDYVPAVSTQDISGSIALNVDITGEAELELTPVPVPSVLTGRFIDIRRVSVTMPEPADLDELGNPT